MTAEFPAQGANPILTPAQVETALARWRLAGTHAAVSRELCVVACDPAGGGDDATAVAVARGAVLASVEVLRFSDTTTAVTGRRAWGNGPLKRSGAPRREAPDRT